MKSFFTVFGSTIQLLTLNIKTDEDQFPLTQFEDNLLEKIPLLSSFNFLIKFHSDPIILIDIQTSHFGYVVCWDDTDFSDRIMCNLPLSKELNLSYNENKRTPPVFEHVRTILLKSRGLEWSMKIFEYFMFITNCLQ